LPGRVFVLSFEGNDSDDTWYLGYKTKYFGALYLFIFVFVFCATAPSGPWPPLSRGF